MAYSRTTSTVSEPASCACNHPVIWSCLSDRGDASFLRHPCRNEFYQGLEAIRDTRILSGRIWSTRCSTGLPPPHRKRFFPNGNGSSRLRLRSFCGRFQDGRMLILYWLRESDLSASCAAPVVATEGANSPPDCSVPFANDARHPAQTPPLRQTRTWTMIAAGKRSGHALSISRQSTISVEAMPPLGELRWQRMGQILTTVLAHFAQGNHRGSRKSRNGR